MCRFDGFCAVGGVLSRIEDGSFEGRTHAFVQFLFFFVVVVM